MLLANVPQAVPASQEAPEGLAATRGQGAWATPCTMGSTLAPRAGVGRAFHAPRRLSLTCDDRVHALVEKGHSRRAAGEEQRREDQAARETQGKRLSAPWSRSPKQAYGRSWLPHTLLSPRSVAFPEGRRSP